MAANRSLLNFKNQLSVPTRPIYIEYEYTKDSPPQQPNRHTN